MQDAKEHGPIRSLFEAKLEQLDRTETQMGDADKSGLTAIEPGSHFAATYVVRFSWGSTRAEEVPNQFQCHVCRA